MKSFLKYAISLIIHYSLAVGCIWLSYTLAGLNTVIGLFGYLGIVFVCTNLLPLQHRKGMGNIRNQNFKRAIINFEKCYAYFSKHPFLDKYGLIFLLNTGDIDYKLSSLLNQAFCHKMLGNHSKSTSIYENVLSLYPKNKVATLGLAMIKAEQNEHK